MEDEFAEVDLSEQIDNRWSRDTAIAIKKRGTNYSVKIKSKDKNDLKSKFIRRVENKADRRHNRQVVVIIYCFLLYHLLKLSRGLRGRIRICNDVSPTWAVNKYLDVICKINGEQLMTTRYKISFKRGRDKRSGAHYIARDVARGRKQATIIFKKQHIDRLKYLIKKIM